MAKLLHNKRIASALARRACALCKLHCRVTFYTENLGSFYVVLSF
jgi:hypothetical protein